jgi:uncharacterized protein HemY
MKNFLSRIALMLFVLTFVTSCDIIGDIFQAGLVVGIIIVVLIIALIFWIIRKFKRR